MTTNGHVYEVTFGRQRVAFSVEFRDRERLSISVHPDQTVTVLAPNGRSVDEVVARVQNRAAWIVKQRLHFDQIQPLTPARRFVSGETHLYLGRQYRLKLVQDAAMRVTLKGRLLWVHLPDRDDKDRIELLLDRWYRAHAESIFARRLDDCLRSACSLAASPPQLVIRKMSKRWGSCTKGGRVLLNIELVRTPLYCIEYVIMHELCHLKIHDHSPQFYRLLARCMPDWEQRKRRLESFVL